jgi:hypothetical protein
MKKLIACSILAALAAAPMAASAAEASVYADVLSAYVFNGQVGNDEAVFQPGLDIAGPLGLGYSLWANMNLTDVESAWYPDSAGEWGELNLGLNWTCPAEGPVGLVLGATYYVFPQDSSRVEENDDGSVDVSKAPADGGYEVYAKISADTLPLTPTLKLYHGMANSEDWIALLAISHSFGLTDALSLDLGATVGYAGDYYIANDYGSEAGSSFSHALFEAGLNYAVSDAFSVGLKGAFSSILDSDVRDDIEAGLVYPEVDIFFGGVTASYSF